MRGFAQRKSTTEEFRAVNDYLEGVCLPLQKIKERRNKYKKQRKQTSSTFYSFLQLFTVIHIYVYYYVFLPAFAKFCYVLLCFSLLFLCVCPGFEDRPRRPWPCEREIAKNRQQQKTQTKSTQTVVLFFVSWLVLICHWFVLFFRFSVFSCC